MAAWTVGARIGSYVLLAPIGAGGMGEVWKARDTRLDRVVAIKRLRQRPGARLKQEARAIAALNHPHICQIHDVGPDYLVLEYVDGQPLKGPQDVDRAVQLACQIADALKSVHEKGIIHRDLKPANILVTAEGSVKLLDFGLAKLTQPVDISQQDTTLTCMPRTDPGTVMGTAPYMSPEQLKGEPLDARSDVFSLGTVLYELLSGRQAFRGENSVSTIAAILHTEPEPLDTPAVLKNIVKRCLAKSPAQRYQSMAEVRAALGSISSDLEEIQPSIAVLPFANMSRRDDDEYFSDGLAEEIINALAQISGIKVIARTSAFAFKGRNVDIRKIAHTLGVTNLLEGSVRRAGDRLRITADLVHATDGCHLWSQRYDCELTDVFAVQDEIAAAITGALCVKLTGKCIVGRPHEPGLSAYEAFLRARYELITRPGITTEAATARAEDFLNQAIALDPQWADPHAALSRLHFFLALLGLRPLSEMICLSRKEARNALQLLRSDPVAHAVLGAIAGSYDYDWKEADEQFRLARASEFLAPGAHDLYATSYLLPLGRFEEAIEQQAKAIAHDPLNTLWRARQCICFLWAEMYERAMAEAHKVLASDDSAFLCHQVLALSYFLDGRLASAREFAESALRQAPWGTATAGLLAGLLVQSGEKDRAEKLIGTMRGTASVGMIFYHLVCSEIDAAIDAYECAINQRQLVAPQLASAGFLKPLRASRRWPKLARMMNLPESA